MPYQEGRWIVLADQFPAGLVTNLPDSSLEPTQTPLAYGLDPAAEGFLKTGSIPTGTARIQKTFVVDVDGGNKTFTWLFNRLWIIDPTPATNRLVWGAPNYQDAWYPQRNGCVSFGEDAQPIVEFLQIGATAMLVCKSTGSYVIQNASSDRADWNITDINQELTVAAATNVTELDGVGYISNTKGLFAVAPDGSSQEVSFPIRDILTSAYALTVDYQRKYIILGSDFCYDTLTKRWFDYRTAGSLYQTPVIQQESTNPFVVKSLAFDYDKTDTSDVEVTVQTRFGNNDWVTEDPFLILEEDGERDSKHLDIGTPLQSRSFAARVTIPSNLKIKRIYARVENYTRESRDR